MLKIMKVFLLSIGVLMIGGLPTISAQEAFKVPQEDYEKFLGLGMSETQIEMMTEAEYEMLKEIDGEIVSTETKYFEVTDEQNKQNSDQEIINKSDISNDASPVELDEDTYFKRVLESQDDGIAVPADNYTPGVANKAYYKLTTYLSKRANNKFNIHTSTVWSKMPGTRGKDVIGTTINSSFWRVNNGTHTGKQTWTQKVACGTSSQKEIVYNSSNSNWTYGKSGYALTIGLPANYNPGTPCYGTQVTDLVSFVSFQVEPIGPSIRVLDAYGHYSHQKLGLGVSPSISFSGTSIGLTPSYNYEPAATNNATYKW